MVSSDEKILLEMDKTKSELCTKKSCERYENGYRLFCKEKCICEDTLLCSRKPNTLRLALRRSD